MRPAPGQILAGRYRVERVLGEGGMGVVLAARHIELGELVALKLLRSPAGATKVHDVARFRREARAAARIKGEHAARAIDSGTHDDMPFIAFEYVEGRSLAAEVKERGPMPLADAARCILEACEALAEAHSLGIVHRDIKPSNLMLTRGPDGSPLLKVLDFGIARVHDEAQATLTSSAATLGSPRYMPPEQIRNPHGADARADVWALGVTLFELLTARVPFEATTAPAVFAAILTDEPSSSRRHRPELPPEVDSLLLHCLEKDRNARLPDVEALALGLAPFVPDGAARAARVGRILRRPVSMPEIAEPPASSDETVSPTTLRDTLGKPTSVTAKDARISVAPLPRPDARRRAPLLPLLGAGLAALAAVGFGLSSRAPRPPAPVALAPSGGPPSASAPALASAASPPASAPPASAPSLALAPAQPSAAAAARAAASALPPRPGAKPQPSATHPSAAQPTAAQPTAAQPTPAPTAPATPQPPQGPPDLEFGPRK